MSEHPWWMPSTSRVVLWAGALVVGLVVRYRMSRVHGRRLVTVRPRGGGLETAARAAVWLVLPHAMRRGTWAVCERGIELPRDYNNGFLPWTAIARVNWDGLRLLVDTEAAIFQSALERYELDVPPDQLPEVAQAISGRVAL